MRYSYRASYKPATGIGISVAFTAGQSKQIMTLHHTAGSTRTVRINAIWISVIENTNNSSIRAETIRLTATTAPSGGTSITPTACDSSDPASEAIAQVVPTTAGSEGGTFSLASAQVGNLNNNTTSGNGVLGASVLYEWVGDNGSQTKQLTLRKGVAEGIAVKIFTTDATTFVCETVIDYTEE